MAKTYSPSVNIIRDENSRLEYFATPNSEKAAISIINDFKKGVHAFSLIGSYGTGKSSFLWALQQELSGEENYFDVSLPKHIKFISHLNVVGSFESITDHFKEILGVRKVKKGNQEIFDSLYQLYEEVGVDDGLLVIQIDELGKFLEYAVEHDPGSELYFIQQLAEFANAENRNILLLTTLHQSFDAYGGGLKRTERNEWRKVKGRLVDIPFNEPIEQLLFLAAEKIDGKVTAQRIAASKSMVKLIEKNHLFKTANDFLEKAAPKLSPLDPIAAYTLTAALQKYGQNERSLFSFLSQFDETKSKMTNFGLGEVYDYLFDNYYSFLNNRSNPDFIQWMGIKNAIERSETALDSHRKLSSELLKSIGLLSLFTHKGASTDLNFYQKYLGATTNYTKKQIEDAVTMLEKAKIIRYQRFNKSFKLFEGTDLDIEGVLSKAENEIDDQIDFLAKLGKHFDFPIITAKAESYKTGTPRLFEFLISDEPLVQVPKDEIDGFINLVFSTDTAKEELKSFSKDCDEAMIFCLFKNTDKVLESLMQIEKSETALKNIEAESDLVANREIRNIISSHKALLNHYVLEALYSENVTWVCDGEELKINNARILNRTLSDLASTIYAKTPVLRNELFNKHKVSSAIHTARRNLFNRVVENWKDEDLGFPEDKFPAEKTIYLSLLKETGLHSKAGSDYELTPPKKSSPIYDIWKESEKFMDSCKLQQRSITELYDILEQRPFKLKRGLTDFWVPLFLFIKRGDYALYGDQGFIPSIDDTRLHLMIKSPDEHEVKSFELSDVRVKLFNRYRELMNLENDSMSNESFIQCIRPILMLYRNLTDYAKQTKRLRKGTLELRSTISKARDPEGVFFEGFPKALGYTVGKFTKSQEAFEEYIIKFQKSISELNHAYDELLNRFEKFIQAKVIGSEVGFEEYRSILEKRYSDIDSHKLLNHQKTFVLRLSSRMGDRESYLESIAHAVIGKKLQKIEDADEDRLYDGLLHLLQELDNLLEIQKHSDPQSETLKLDITTKEGGLKEKVVRIPKKKQKEVNEGVKRIDKELGKDKLTRIAILSTLLKNELHGK